MGWVISRQEATLEPEIARRKVLALLGNLEDIPDAERLLLSILTDAVLIVEAYRGSRHQIALLPELQQSVDALLRELRVVERIRDWSREQPAAGRTSAAGGSGR